MKILNAFDRFFNFSRPLATKTNIFLAGFCSLLLLTVLSVIDRHLTNTFAPNGIVSFELSGNLLNSLKILASWDATSKIWAGISLGLDYLFLIIYPLFFFFIIIFLTDKIQQSNGLLFYMGVFSGLLQLGAGILDAVENYALIQILTGHFDAIFVSMARICATFKFAFIIVGFISILILLGRIGYDKNS